MCGFQSCAQALKEPPFAKLTRQIPPGNIWEKIVKYWQRCPINNLRNWKVIQSSLESLLNYFPCMTLLFLWQNVTLRKAILEISPDLIYKWLLLCWFRLVEIRLIVLGNCYQFTIRVSLAVEIYLWFILQLHAFFWHVFLLNNCLALI